MKEVVAVRHVHFEDLGSLGQVLRERGARITYVDAGRDRLIERVAHSCPDLLVVLGGPIGAYESDTYPFLHEELALIRSQLRHNRPLIGVCLGAQLIAVAMGAKVYPAEAKEMGWATVDLSVAGGASPLAELTTPVFHWHGDTFDLPTGTVHLASTPTCRNQAFSVGPHVLGLQFHAELSSPAIESWLIGHAHEIAHTPEVSVTRIRSDTQRFGHMLETASRRLFNRWLDETNT